MALQDPPSSLSCTLTSPPWHSIATSIWTGPPWHSNLKMQEDLLGEFTLGLLQGNLPAHLKALFGWYQMEKQEFSLWRVRKDRVPKMGKLNLPNWAALLSGHRLNDTRWGHVTFLYLGFYCCELYLEEQDSEDLFSLLFYLYSKDYSIQMSILVRGWETLE